MKNNVQLICSVCGSDNIVKTPTGCLVCEDCGSQWLGDED